MKTLFVALRALFFATCFFVLWGWLAVVLLTHYGGWSPYSYAWTMFEKGVRIEGVVVNPDAETTYSVFQFFYEPRPVAFELAHNLIYPLPFYVAGNFAAFTRSYILAHYLTNLLFLFALCYVAVRVAAGGLVGGSVPEKIVAACGCAPSASANTVSARISSGLSPCW